MTNSMRNLMEAVEDFDPIVGGTKSFTIGTLRFTKKDNTEQSDDLVELTIKGYVDIVVRTPAHQSAATLYEPAEAFDEEDDVNLDVKGNIAFVPDHGSFYPQGSIDATMPNGIYVGIEIDGMENVNPETAQHDKSQIAFTADVFTWLRMLPVYIADALEEEVNSDPGYYL